MAHFAYDYNPAKTIDYRQSKITNDRFFAWTAENMYRTSYATSYTDVKEIPCIMFKTLRNLKNPKIM